MKSKSSWYNVVIASVLLSMLFAGAGFATVLAIAGSSFVLESIGPFGDKPFFEVWDEDFPGPCSLGVAMDGTVLMFKDQQEPDIVGVKRSADGGKTWGPMIELGKRVKIDEDMSDDGRYKGKFIQLSQLGTHVVDENTGDIIVFANAMKGPEIHLPQ